MISRRRIVAVAGHSEYWSKELRDGFDAARAAWPDGERIDHEEGRFGFHGSAGLMRVGAMVQKLSTDYGAALVHGMSTGGGQAISLLRRERP